METIKNFLTGKYEILNYCIFYFLIIISTFNYFLIFLLMLFAFISLPFNKNFQQIVIFDINFSVFSGFFSSTFIYLIKIYISVILFVNLLIKLFKHEIKIPIFVIICYVIYCTFVCLTFGYKKILLLTYLYKISSLLLIITVYYLKDCFNFEKLAYALIASFLINIIISLFYGSSVYLFDNNDGVYRFCALQGYPTILAIRSLVIFSVVLVLKYYEKINDSVCLAIISILFFTGILTISRLFLFGTIISYIVFSAFYIYKNKKSAKNFLLYLLICMITISLLSNNILSSFLIRFKRDETLAPIVKSTDYDKIVSGELHYDYGRVSLWKLYIKRITESLKTILLGFGYNAPYIGEEHAHCLLLWYIYKNGLIGLLLLCLQFYLLLDKKKIKLYKQYLPITIFLVGYYFMALLDNNVLYSTPYILLVVFCNGKLWNISDEEKMKDSYLYFLGFNKNRSKL